MTMERTAQILLRTTVQQRGCYVLFNTIIKSNAVTNVHCCHVSQLVSRGRLHCRPTVVASRPYLSHIRTPSTKQQVDFLAETEEVFSQKEKKLRGQQRSEVSRKVTEQLRQDVLVNSLLYKDSIIMSRKAWVDHADSFTVIHQLKMADSEVKMKLLSSLSDGNILAMMSCTMNHRELLKRTPLLELLEDECCRRINTLDLRTMLLLADNFYVLKHSQTKYMRTLLQSIDLHWNSLEVTPQGIVQLLFYIGTYRNAPIELMERIENFLVDNILDMTGCQVGLICHAFFSSNMSLRSYPLMNKMADIVLTDLPRMKSYLVANVLKVFRHANFSNSAFYEKLGDADILRKESYVSTIIHFVTTYSAMRFVHDGLYESAAQKLSQCLRNNQNHAPIRMKDFTKFLWAYATLQRPVPETILEAAVECARRDRSLWRKYPETFIECLVSLVMNGVYPEDLINYALSRHFLRLKQGTHFVGHCALFEKCAGEKFNI